jgi:hypothetical protein
MYNYTLNVANLPKNLALLHIRTAPSHQAPAPIVQPSPNRQPTKLLGQQPQISAHVDNSLLTESRAEVHTVKCATHNKNVEGKFYHLLRA